MFVLQVIAQQVLAYVLATVINVLALVQYLIVQPMLLYVLATVINVLVLVQHTAVQRVMLSVLMIIAHVVVRVVAQRLIVSHVLLPVFVKQGDAQIIHAYQ